MRFVSQPYQLFQYNRCKNDLCYNEPFDVPTDIVLQSFIADQSSDTKYHFQVLVISSDGYTIIRDISLTIDYVVGKDLQGRTYFNLRPNQAANLPDCFLLKVILTNASGQTLFTGYTEPYEHISVGCRGLSVILLEGVHVCYDIAGRYYGAPKALLQQANAFLFNDRHLLRGRLKRMPTDIKRSVTENGCRSIRTDISRLYTLEGFDLYAQWKVDELEHVFAANAIQIMGQEYIFRGGTLFEAEKIPCSCGFILAAKLEQCNISQEYGCEAACLQLCTYYIIGGVNKDQPYFDDAGKAIGNTLEALKTWFTAKEGIVSVTELNVMGVNCSTVGALKIDSNGTLPNFLYWGDTTQQNKVYARLAPCDTIDICDGLPGKCITPGIINAQFIDGCITPGIISAQFINTPAGCGITGFDNWIIQPRAVSTISNTGQIHLQFVVRNTTYAGYDSTDPLAENIAVLTGSCIASGQTYTITASGQQPGAMPAGSSLYVQGNGTILFTGRPSNVISSYAEITIDIYYQQ